VKRKKSLGGEFFRENYTAKGAVIVTGALVYNNIYDNSAVTLATIKTILSQT